MIDLQPFCGTEDDTRSFIHKPCSVAEYSFATNGHIIVRIPRREEYPEAKIKGSWPGHILKVFSQMPVAGFVPLVLPSDLPKPQRVIRECLSCDGRGYGHDCPSCDGRGYGHDCPSCECKCEDCDAKGSYEEDETISCDVFGSILDAKYLRLIADLPGVEIAPVKEPGNDPVPYRFHGGNGFIMPRRRHGDHHIDILP